MPSKIENRGGNDETEAPRREASAAPPESLRVAEEIVRERLSHVPNSHPMIQSLRELAVARLAAHLPERTTPVRTP